MPAIHQLYCLHYFHVCVSKLENTISAKDLIALAAEDADDANRLLKLRGEPMKLRINVVTVQANPDMAQYQPDSQKLEYFIKNKKQLDFKGYVSEMFTAPNPIKAYLCQQFRLHKIPIFGVKAESHVQNLVESENVFFIGETLYKTITSRYDSSQKSTSSAKVPSRKWMHKSLDKEVIQQSERELKKVQEEHQILHNRMRECIENKKKAERLVEAKKKDLKELQQKLQYKKVLKGKLGAKIEQRRVLENEAKSVDVEMERSRIDKEKRHYISQTVRLNADLKTLLGNLIIKVLNIRLYSKAYPI